MGGLPEGRSGELGFLAEENTLDVSLGVGGKTPTRQKNTTPWNPFQN